MYKIYCDLTAKDKQWKGTTKIKALTNKIDKLIISIYIFRYLTYNIIVR